MKKALIAIFITILTSLYIFPFNTVWMPSVNTKMALAAFAPIILLLDSAKKRDAQMGLSLFVISIYAIVVSLMGFMSCVINNTNDYSYATYIVSMWVWLGGAYVVIKAMKWAYGKVSIRMIGNFLIAVSVMQCVLSQLISISDVFSNFVDRFMVSTGFMGKVEDRLYGIGCALDVAGIKFCAVLIIIAFFSISPVSKERQNLERIIYIVAFFVIAIYGSMIARTTSIGIVLSILLWIFCYFFYSQKVVDVSRTIKMFCISIGIVLPIVILLYHVNDNFYTNIRFAFEGVFSLLEEGKWEVRSQTQMFSMVIWPDNLKTWLIGDGYFSSPMNDYYYIGPSYYYYMGTDVGYCRFIFYFGLLGLGAFASFFVKSAAICSQNNPKYKIMFCFILLINFIVWIKVSSDIFSIFALFLLIREDGVENEISDEIKGSIE